MLMCFDIGNSHIYGSFYFNDSINHKFRINTKAGWSSDQLGIFLKSFCREHDIDIQKISKIAISSVVPSLDYHFRNCCIKYFNQEPLIVKAGIKMGVSLSRFKYPHEIGADLICNAVGAINDHPNQNLLIIDMGTATTITLVNKEKEYLAGVIIPGPKTQIDSLAVAAEKLFGVELVEPKEILPKSTLESIQVGIYYSHLGGIGLLMEKLSVAAFGDEGYISIATGGFSRFSKDWLGLLL